MFRSQISAVLAAALTLGVAPGAFAVGTAAGTSIQNTAQVTYTVAGVGGSATSNIVDVRVDEVLDAVLTIASATVATSPGAAQQELLFTLTNTGNGTETFELTALSAGVTGDDFDPTLAAPAIYFDSDASGDLSAGDAPHVAGSNDPVLAADASVRILVVNDIPAATSNAQRGRSELTASASTGSGTPGTPFDNAGDAGVDAVVGMSGADATLYGEYLVNALSLSAVKSQTVVDQSGGSRVQSGARITYQIVVSASGSGAANGAVFADLIPASTTYVAGSLALNNATLTDGADSDAGQFATTPAPEVRVNLGDLTSGAGPQTIEFAVTVN